ncbi:hypothetical protein ACA910_015110 [Epithemia clementina (nom. ined.)]
MMDATKVAATDTGDSKESDPRSSLSSWISTFAKAKNPPMSVYMVVVLIFVTHGLVNATLLYYLGDNVRYLFGNATPTDTSQEHHCSWGQSWMWNWMAVHQFHVYLLLTCLASTAFGNAALEQRLGVLVGTMAVSYLSNGIFLLDQLHQPMALLQALIYLGLILTLAFHFSITQGEVAIAITTTTTDGKEGAGPPTNQKDSPFPMQLSASTIVLGLLCVLSLFQLVDMTFLDDRSHHYSFVTAGNWISDADLLFQRMAQASAANLLWVTLLLAWSAALATPLQQKAVLIGHAVALLLAQVMLFTMTIGSHDADDDGQEEQSPLQIKHDFVQAARLGNFCTMLVAIMGLY